MERYIRQIALPDIGLTGQGKIKSAHIVMVGAGGLGTSALPALAGAGIGKITIIDHDEISLSNLHRQTIYRNDQINQNKAESTENYLRALNPEVNITTIKHQFTEENANEILASLHDITLLLDGTDNFKTKALINQTAIQHKIPLITASVNQWQGQIGIFEGHKHDHSCYQCLFPEFPNNAKNCNEAGILGTTANIIGLYQAHIALLKITDNINFKSNFITINLKTIRAELFSSPKDTNCIYCNHEISDSKNSKQNKIKKETHMTEMIDITQLNDRETIIIDVRNPDEIQTDPLSHDAIQTAPINIPLPQLIQRLDELPTDKRLAFICAGNIRSRQATDYLTAKGYENICVLDKFSL